MYTAIEQSYEQLDQLVTDAAQAFGKDIGAQQQHGANLGLFQWFAQAAGMAAHQVALQLLEVFAAYTHIGQLAEAGVDSISGFIAGNNAIDHGLGRGYSLTGSRRNGYAHRSGSYLADLVEREWLPIQFEDADGETRCHADHRMSFGWDSASVVEQSD